MDLQTNRSRVIQSQSAFSQCLVPIQQTLEKRKACSCCSIASRLLTVEHHNPIHVLEVEQRRQHWGERRASDWDCDQILNNGSWMRTMSPCMNNITLKKCTNRLYDAVETDLFGEITTPNRIVSELPPKDVYRLIPMNTLRRSYSESYSSKRPTNELSFLKEQQSFL